MFAGRNKNSGLCFFGYPGSPNDAQILDGKFPCTAIGLEGMICAGMEIVPFHTSHDCAEGYGYLVKNCR